jgi:hypothetical protein
MAAPRQHFHLRSNIDGTVDLLCLECRALVRVNSPPRCVPAVQFAHRCRLGNYAFDFRSLWVGTVNSRLCPSGECGISAPEQV